MRMHTYRIGLLVFLLGTGLSSSIHAQTLSTGARVRVSAPGIRGTMVGTVHHMDSTRLTLVPTRGPMRDTISIPLHVLRGLEVSRGHEPREQAALRGGRIGGLSGGAGGAVLGLIVAVARAEIEAGRSEGPDRNERGYKLKYTLTGGAVAGVLGAVTGAVLGARNTEVWQKMPAIPHAIGYDPLASAVSVSIRM